MYDSQCTMVQKSSCHQDHIREFYTRESLLWFLIGEIHLEDKDKINTTNFMIMFSTGFQRICFASFLCFVLLERKKLLAVLNSRCLILNEYIQWESISLLADNMASFLFFQKIYSSLFRFITWTGYLTIFLWWFRIVR